MNELVSVVIPAYRAEAKLADAVRSLISQTWSTWECIVVSDDGVNYKDVLASSELSDPRLRHVSTGALGTGCHAARNRGLTECQGEIICALDADDVWLPRRLEILVPRTVQYGAAVDGPAVVTSDGRPLYNALDSYITPFMLDIHRLLRATCPLFPLTRRDVTLPRTEGIEHLEDVVSNLLLISSNGPIWATPEPLMEYRVVTGSMCHADDSGALFDRAYAEVLRRIATGSLLIPLERRAEIISGLEEKRALNRRFEKEFQGDPTLNFQTFAATHRP
jgi:glycosyltransferase involved in cell wall biosynthesis